MKPWAWDKRVERQEMTILGGAWTDWFSASIYALVCVYSHSETHFSLYGPSEFQQQQSSKEIISFSSRAKVLLFVPSLILNPKQKKKKKKMDIAMKYHTYTSLKEKLQPS